jgi:hypothetical protein
MAADQILIANHAAKLLCRIIRLPAMQYRTLRSIPIPMPRRCVRQADEAVHNGLATAESYLVGEDTAAKERKQA